MKLTNQIILKQAIIEIKNSDYQNFSMRKLATKLDTTAAAIYKHFKNKDDLFKEMTVYLSNQFAQNLKLDEAASAEVQLLEIAQQFCENFENNTNLMDFLFFNPQAAIAMNIQNQDFKFFNLVKELVHQVNSMNDTDNNLFIKLWSFIQGYALLIKNKVITYDPDLVKTTLTELLGEKR